jgi:uncharacterized protein (DUF885 family)
MFGNPGNPSLFIAVWLVSSAASPTFASPPRTNAEPSLQARLGAQTQLFEEQFEDDLNASPETATSYGDYRHNALLDHYSLAASAQQNAIDRKKCRVQLQAISTAGFREQDRISHDLLLYVLDQRNADYSLKEYEMPLSRMEGIQNSIAYLPRAVPLDSVQHYQDYIERLHQVPRAFNETIEVLRRGEKDSLMPPRLLLEQVPAQCESTIAENPFLEPTMKFPPSISAADRKRLTDKITQAVKADVLPAYRRFADFIATDYAPHGRTTPGLGSLPDGQRRYQNAIREQTSTDMSPAEIHSLGLRSYRAALLADPGYTPKSSDRIVENFRRYITQMQPRLQELFGVFSGTPVAVEEAPPSQTANMRHHVPGTPDDARPGRIVVATSNYAHRKLLYPWSCLNLASTAGLRRRALRSRQELIRVELLRSWRCRSFSF